MMIPRTGNTLKFRTAALVTGLCALFISGQAMDSNAASPFVQDELLVQHKAGVAAEQIHGAFAGLGASVVGELPQIRVKRIKVPANAMEKVKAALARNPFVSFVEPNFLGQSSGVPNDAQYSSQWHLPMVWAPRGWDVNTGSASVPIAIIDSGVDSAHPDLAGKVVAGWNFLGGNTNTSDVLGHGTAVAGTASAASNNSTGVAGLAWQNPIMPLVVLDATDYASYSNIASAITYAADHGVRVINVSIGGSSSSSTLQGAVDYAWNKGAIIFASAMNNGTSTPYYPAACNRVIAVTATTSTDTIAGFSSFGTWVDIAAPGASILTTTRGGGYGYWNGTSFASPLAAGLAALVLSVNPSLTNAAVESIIKSNADDLGAAGFDQYFGSGRINTYYALLAAKAAVPAPDTTAPTASISSPAAGSTVSGAVTVNVAATDDVGVTKVELYVDGVLVATDSVGPFSFFWDTTKLVDGSHNLLAVAYDQAGNVGQSATVTVTTSNPVDTIAPVATITNPSNGATVGGRVAIRASATDNIGVRSTQLFIDGVLKSTVSGGSMSYTWNTKNVPVGGHTITMKSFDGAGNTGTSSITVFK